MLTYRVRLDVPRELVLFVSRLLARHRKEIGTRKNTRSLGCYRQALFVLAWYRDKADIPAAGCRVRPVAGNVVPLRSRGHEGDRRGGARPGGGARTRGEGGDAVRDPGRQDRLLRPLPRETVSRKGREIDLWYSGKKKDFGGNIQGLFYPGGLPMWISDVLPGNVHDLAAARENVLPVLRNYVGEMPGLADCGYEGAGHGILTPVKKPKGVKEPDINTRTRNMLLSSARCLGERGFALLSQRWKTLQNVTASPSEIGPIARAALVLTLFEHKRLT